MATPASVVVPVVDPVLPTGPEPLVLSPFRTTLFQTRAVLLFFASHFFSPFSLSLSLSQRAGRAVRDDGGRLSNLGGSGARKSRGADRGIALEIA